MGWDIRNPETASAVVAAARVLGLLMQTPEAWAAAKQAQAGVDNEAIERLITARLDARRAKNFAESDRLRDELAAMGIALKDGKDPATGEPTTSWEVKR
jgi:cysteinyl-tRNA synthetase